MRAAAKSLLALPPYFAPQLRTTAAAFLVLTAIGFTLGTLRPETLSPMMRLFTEAAAGAGFYQVENGVLMVTILANNLLALLLAVALGLVPFLNLPALELGVNALMIGALAAYYRDNGLGLTAYFAGTLPHGVTELTALILACSAGLYLCRAVSNSVLGNGSAKIVASVLSQCLRVFVRLIAPLLLISAFLEAFVTPTIFGRFL